MEKTPDKVEDLETLTPKAFGQMLKAGRLSKGVSIEQVASATRILQQFIIALEEGDFDKLPGKVFGRGFVKSICKTLDLPSQDLIKDFDASFEKPAALSEPLKSSKRVRKVNTLKVAKIGLERSQNFVSRLSTFVPESVRRNVTPLGLAGVLAAVGAFTTLVLLTIGLFSGSEKKESTVEPTVAEQIQDEAVPDEAPASADQEVAAVQSETQSETSGFESPIETIAKPEAEVVKPPQVESKPDPNAPGEVKVTSENIGAEQVLEITVKKTVRLRMQIDKDTWQTLQLEPKGYRYTFKESAHLLVFNAAAVDVSFNGKPLGELGSEGRVRRISFMAQPTDLGNFQKL